MAHRIPLWLPYLNSISEDKKGVWTFAFNGGEEKVSLDKISCIMIYGESDVEFKAKDLDKIARKGIPIIIHRRNMSMPIYISAGPRPDDLDTLTAQINARAKSRTATHIARQLIIAKMSSMKWLVDPIEIPQYCSIDKIRQIEAQHAKKYWKKWFIELGRPDWTRRPKDSEDGRTGNTAQRALDAASKFISGITLRWVTYHHLSPHHGFLHTPTDYPALVYDLMEPYRGIFEQVLLKEFQKHINDEKVDIAVWANIAVKVLKDKLNDKCYVPLTRQIVTYQELLHGNVLSLKYYCLGKQKKFHIPIPGLPKGGRPPKVDFLLYGRHAGKTDFWKVANQLAKGQRVSDHMLETAEQELILPVDN